MVVRLHRRDDSDFDELDDDDKSDDGSLTIDREDVGEHKLKFSKLYLLTPRRGGRGPPQPTPYVGPIRLLGA